MLILKHLKTLQHVSIFIQIVFRVVAGSLLNSPKLKVTEFKNFLKGQLWWCGSITFGVCAWRSVWGGMLDYSPTYLPTLNAHTPNVMLPHHHNWPFKKFLNSVTFNFDEFNKEPATTLKTIWIKIETCWSVFKCFKINILD